jgi:hypothetical protein
MLALQIHLSSALLKEDLGAGNHLDLNRDHGFSAGIGNTVKIDNRGREFQYELNLYETGFSNLHNFLNFLQLFPQS